MKTAAALALLLLASFALYAPSLDHYFVSDDFLNRERNEVATLGDALHCFATTDVDFYRPIPRLHFGFAQAYFGDDAIAWNVLGVLLHAVASALAAALALELLGSGARRAAFLTGLFFAVHFAHAEAVVWASGVPSVYDAIFLFTAILLFRRARRTGKARDLSLSVLAFAGALLSKESATAFVLLLPLTTWLAPPRGPDGRATSPWPSVREGIPFGILFVGYAAIVLPIDRGGDLSPYQLWFGAHVFKNLAFFFLGSFVPVRFWQVQDLWSASAGTAVAGAGGALPGGTSAFLNFLNSIAAQPLLAWPLVAGAVSLAVLTIRGGRTVRGFLAWILFAAAPHLLLPGSGERFLYVPSFGACAVLGLGAAKLVRRPEKATSLTKRGRIRWRGILRVVFPVAGMLALHVAGSLDRQGDWSTAGKWTRGIVGRWGFLRGLPAEESIEFVGVPDRWGSAWVFRNGFPSMVRTFWEGRPYWREEERPPGAHGASRMGVILHPGGYVGMMPAQLMPERLPWPRR